MVNHDTELCTLLALPKGEGVVGVTTRVDLVGDGERNVLGGTLEVFGIIAIENE
jgi:hypothetical protein